MVFYQNIIITTKGKMDSMGNIIEPPTETQQYMGTLYTTVYSVVVIIFGTLYKKLAEV
jgi:hypothetical protein